MDKQTTIIEINGIKMEIDLRNAKRIDTLRIDDRVKCLVKGYVGTGGTGGNSTGGGNGYGDGSGGTG